MQTIGTAAEYGSGHKTSAVRNSLRCVCDTVSNTAVVKRLTGLSGRHLIAIWNEHARPSPAMREMLARVAAEYAERLAKFRLQ